MSGNIDPDVDAELELAREALTAANILRTHDNTENSTIDRLYYACFHATKALLYQRGHSPNSHQGVLTLFGQHVVQQGDVSPEHGQFLDTMMKERHIADYEHTPVSIDID